MGTDTAPFEPRRPTLIAGSLLSLWVLILSLPMFVGRFVAVYPNDQYAAGYAFRHWLAEQLKATGSIPLWNPELFGGLPFVAGMHGDIFYPTSWLRLVLPTHIAMDLGFTLHYVLAGLFLYLFLRRMNVSWTGAVTGGIAYQLSGVVGSLVSPGHDGKLFVTALLPLALLAMIMAFRERRPAGYALLALTVGLGILSPHYQMVYYLLLIAGIFGLYLLFGEGERASARNAALQIGGAMAAVVVGFGIGAIQLLPFYHYVPYSPRAVTYGGFADAASYAIPWSHVPELFLAGFTGSHDTYWATNPLKYHSEYLGLPVIALAILGIGAPSRRRTVWWLGGIGVLFLLVALGSATPFYRLWYAVMPMVKQTRAPGMALFAVAFVLAVFAAFGVERMERKERAGAWRWWAGIGTAIAVLGLAGVWTEVARLIAEGLPDLGYDRVEIIDTASGSLVMGAVGSGVALLALGGLCWGWTTGRVRGVLALALGLVLVVGGDLFRAAKPFWRWSDAPDVALYASDGVTDYLQSRPLPYRVMNLADYGAAAVYPGSALMAFNVPQILGHHGNQLHAFNELMGGKNQWTHLFTNRRLWDLFAVQYVLLPAGIEIGTQLPAWQNLSADFDTVFAGVMTSDGRRAHLLERRNPVPYVRVVGGALQVTDEQAIQALVQAGSGMDPNRLVLLDPETPVTPEPITALPPGLPVRGTITDWRPGAMSVRLDPAPERDAWLVVAENWYPDWQATVDGREAQVVRGNVTMITVPVPAGAREVTLRFDSADYRLGRTLTFISLVVVVLGFAVPPVLRRRRG